MLWVGFGLVRVLLGLLWVWFGLVWVSFGFVWVWFGLAWVCFRFAWGWVAFGLDWFGVSIKMLVCGAPGLRFWGSLA